MQYQAKLATAITSLGLCMIAHATSISGQETWETVLQGRDLDGNPRTYEAYYDTTLGITWAANAQIIALR